MIIGGADGSRTVRTDWSREQGMGPRIREDTGGGNARRATTRVARTGGGRFHPHPNLPPSRGKGKGEGGVSSSMRDGKGGRARLRPAA